MGVSKLWKECPERKGSIEICWLLDLYFDRSPKNGRGILLVKYFGDNYKKNYEKDFEHCNPPIMKIIVLVRLLKLLYKKNWTIVQYFFTKFKFS